MKIVYGREQDIGLTIGICISVFLFIMIVQSFIVQGFTKLNILGCIGVGLFSAIFLGAGIYTSKRAQKYKKARKKIVSEGYCCEGTVMDLIYLKDIMNERHRYMQVKYYSILLNKEVEFITSAVSMSIKDVVGAKCTVYEMYNDNEIEQDVCKGFLNTRDFIDVHLTKNLDKDDGVLRVVDTIDESMIKSTKVSDTLFFIGTIIFFIVAGYLCAKQ